MSNSARAIELNKSCDNQVIELNKIHNMDCLEFMKTVPDNFFDLVLTDPPYGIDFGAKKTGKGWVTREGKDWDKEIPPKEIFDEIMRISKNQIIWGGNYFTTYLYKRQCWLVWDKGQRDFSLADGELAWTSYDKALRIFTMSRAAALQEKKGLSLLERHPTMKPEKLFKWCIQEVARINKGDDVKIFDPFMGSGTTAVVCEDLELKWSGCELEVDYIKLANKRLSQVQGSLF